MKKVYTILILCLAVEICATTWATIYPFTQKTEEGKVKVKSFPYAPFSGGHGPGETFVYHKGKLLYTIDRYFTTPIFTSKNGKYLIEVDFYLYFRRPIGRADENRKVHWDPVVYDGDAVRIYENGELKSTIKLSDLNVNTSSIRVGNSLNRFSWNYRSTDSTNLIKERMENHSAYLSESNLHLITSDNQLITIDIPTGKTIQTKNAEVYFSHKEEWKPNKIKRKYRKVRYPDQFSLPKLESGKSIEQALSEFLMKELANDSRDSATVQLYFHTLLINRKGECEFISVSPSTRTNVDKEFSYPYDWALKEKIEKWAIEQKFQIKTIPRRFQKYKYSDFVHLK